MTAPEDDLPTSSPPPGETAPAEDQASPGIDPLDEARYQAEEKRLIGLIARLAKGRGVSIRSMEAKAGVGASVFAKVMSGKVAPSVRHLLRMCDALGVSWDELYGLACSGEDDTGVSPELRKQIMTVLREQGILPGKPKKSP